MKTCIFVQINGIIMKPSTLLALYLALACLASCVYDRELSAALEFSGPNRSELEKVLKHYESDQRKLDAAKFLIRNMPGHYSYAETSELDSIKAVLSDINDGKDVPSDRIERWRAFSYTHLPKIYDSHIITAEYLIENIDLAFEAYDKREWNKYISFDEFCETILPYRVGNETLENWRREYKDKFEYMLDSVYTGTDVIEATNTVFRESVGTFFIYNTLYRTPDLGPGFLMHNHIGGCRETCDYTLYLMRALGVPCYTDLYNQRNVHMWNTVIDTTGCHEQFLFSTWGGNEAVRGGDDGRVKGKVYRIYFSDQSNDGSGVFLRDVTSSYFGENRAKIRLYNKENDGIAWLSIYVNPDWYPIEPYRSLFSKVIFRNFEPGMVFMPLSGHGRLLSEAGYPFMLEKDGTVRTFIPDKSNVKRVSVKRKLRLTNRIKGYMSECSGGILEADVSPDFSTPDTIAVFESPSINYNYCAVDSDREYRYVRYTPAPGKKIQLGEMRFFADALRKDTIAISVHAFTEPIESGALNAIDDDELSFYQSSGESPYIVFKLDETARISLIEWVPRNDDNFIRYGDLYELYFQDGVDKWQSLGRQVAADTVLHFNNVPENALLILRNHTRGVEEEVFIIENGIQRFI